MTYSESETGHATRGAFLVAESPCLTLRSKPTQQFRQLTEMGCCSTGSTRRHQSGYYELYNNGSTPYIAWDSTRPLLTRNYFERRFSYPEGPHNIHMMWSLDAYDAGSWNGVYPTQNLVDAYETTDGKLIDDPTNTLYDPQNPYENRDKRFYQSLLYNGSMWETYEINIVTNTVDESKNGSCKPRLGKARCGYGLRKFIEELDPSTNIYGGYAQSNNFPYFRYAEILLNYAEARNEASSTPDQSVYDAINQVRARAGQPAFPTD